MASSPPSARVVSGAAIVLAIAAFALYRSTLLPGVDFGDSGSFQTTVGSPRPTPRDGYPLYFAIAAGILRLSGDAPARALNLTSALEAAIGCGLFVWLAAELTGSIAAAIGGALLFMVSYTFWSQAVTAEVYALHIVFVLASTILLLRWERQQTLLRLAAFFACYAAGFGNHLSMILLAPGFTAFILLSARDGWRSMFRWQVLVLAAGLAAAGAAQYAWNLRTLWFLPDRPATLIESLQRFWFDVTKADWRDTMVLQVPQSMLRDHAAMYWFDLRQQFGVAAIVLAAVGAAALTSASWRRGLLLLTLYAANVAFAFSYNVGDTHVFYLPSHLIVAILAAAGAAAARIVFKSPRAAAMAATLLCAYAIVRGYRDFPALDRSADHRAERVLTKLTRDLDDQRAILLSDLNWQIANGLSYYTKVDRPEVAVGRLRDVLLYAPALVHDNLAVGRGVALTESARRVMVEAYGPLMPIVGDAAPTPLREIVRSIAPGTRYTLAVLKPTRDYALDREDIDDALARLTGGSIRSMPRGDYAVVAGIMGAPPSMVEGSDWPFTRSGDVGGVQVQVRMESWLSADTIRRMGFGHVIANHRHTLIVERGVSFATFDVSGGATESAYFANLFADPSRFVIRP